MAIDETKAFMERREAERMEDVADGTREKGGRYIANIPEDFMFLARAIGMIRGLAAELQVHCETFHILAMNAAAGLERVGVVAEEMEGVSSNVSSS